MNSIFRLNCEPQDTYSKPLFHSWTPPSEDDEAALKVTIIQDNDSEEKVFDEVATSSFEPSARGPSQRGRQRILLTDNGMDDESMTAAQRNIAHEDSEEESENGLAHLFFPQGFKEMRVRKAELKENGGAILIRNQHLY